MDRIQLISPGQQEVWDRMAAASPTMHYSHCFDWGEFQSQGFWSVRRFGLFRHGELVAGVTCLQPSLKFSPWTFCLVPHGPSYLDAAVIPDLLSGVTEVLKDQGVFFLKMDLDLPLETALPAWVQASGLRPAERETISLGLARARATFRLDVTEPEECLRMKLHHKTRQYIYRYRQSNIKIRPVLSQDDVKVFVELIQETAARHGFTTHNTAYYHRLWETLGGSDCRAGKPAMVWLLAEDRGQAIAGRAAIRFGEGAWDLLAGSRLIGKEFRPNHGLLWSLILWARQSGVRWYDFGGAGVDNESETDHPQYGGVYRFKKSFGGQFVHFHPEMDLVMRVYCYRLWNLAVPTLRRALPWIVRWAETGRGTNPEGNR